MIHVRHCASAAMVLLACGSSPPTMPQRRATVANPFPIEVTLGLSGRYRFEDGSMRLQLDAGEIVQSPIVFRGGAKSLPPGTYDLYIRVTADERPAGIRELEVGIGDALGLVRYSAPRDIGWVGPVRLSPTVNASVIELYGGEEVQLAQFWIASAGGAGPAGARAPTTKPEWSTLWIDLPDKPPRVAWLEPRAPVSIRARIAGAEREAQLGCDILDFEHHVVARHSRRLTFDLGHEQRIELAVPEPYGPYLLRCTGTASTLPPREFQLSVARISSPNELSSASLGGHGNAPLLHAIGAGWTRIWESGGHATTWSRVEPSRDEFRFDQTIDTSLRTIAVLDDPPTWAGIDPSDELWLRYIDRVVRHYANAVDAWEIFNEPYHAPQPAWATAHVARVRAAARVIRAADPSALVASGGPPEEIQPGLEWWRALGEAGLFAPLDVVTAHFYVGGGGAAPLDTDLKLDAYMTDVRAIVDRYGGKGKPIWDTESGIGPNESFYVDRSVVYGYWDLEGFHAHAPVPYRVGAAMAARIFLVHLWHEIRWFYYQNAASYGNAWAAVDFDGSPLPYTVALAQLVRRFTIARPDGRPSLPAGLWGLRFRSAGNSIVVMWAIGPSHRSQKIALPHDARVAVHDMFDNPLPPAEAYPIDIAPLLLIGPASAVDAQLQAIALR